MLAVAVAVETTVKLVVSAGLAVAALVVKTAKLQVCPPALQILVVVVAAGVAASPVLDMAQMAVQAS